MKYRTLSASSLLVAALTATGAIAQCNDYCQPTAYDSFCAGFRANVHWPRQFIPAARRSVCNTYAGMINNGWRRQNLLGDYHFDPHTQQLTEAGKLKVHWVLTQAPMEHRGIFVQRGKDEMQTAERVAAVNSLAANISPAVGPIDVNDTHIVAEGHLASTVDSVFVGYHSNRPAPVLPATGAGGSSTTASQ